MLVKEKLERFAYLLELGGYLDWSEKIGDLAKRYEYEPEYVRRTLLNLYGGMGSLNDLLIYRNGQILITETEEFGQLRVDIFNVIS
ncbi:DUF6966 domain-containing protein [Advenella mimigardefordensis]|uniref:DUF6966 domain-containing protein n=1 Tax=Advenella mimigardefordensis TaxID=302406 RepID=UPI00046D5377|nr:hypothetical protein [Advenella mimigardefordensis]